MGMHTWFECRIRYEKVMDGTLSGGCSQLYRSGSTDYRRDDSIYIRRIYSIGYKTCKLQ